MYEREKELARRYLEKHFPKPQKQAVQIEMDLEAKPSPLAWNDPGDKIKAMQSYEVRKRRKAELIKQYNRKQSWKEWGMYLCGEGWKLK